MKKIFKLLTAVIIIFLGFQMLPAQEIHAAQITEVSGNNAIIDARYSFAPKFTSGVSWAEIYGCTNYSDSDLYRNGSANSGRLPKNSHVALLYNNDVVRSGTIGVRYNNVGYYNGSAIDLKIMLVGGEVRTASADKYPDSNVPGVAIMDNDIDIYQQSYHTRNLLWQFTFYVRGTNTAISVPYHANFKDIDGTEFVDFSYGGVSNAYVVSKSSGGVLDYTSTRVSVGDITSADDDKTHWTTLLGTTSSFKLMYSRAKEQNYADWDKASNSRTFYHWKWSSDSLVRFDTPDISKKINSAASATMHNNDTFSYTLSFPVPNEDPSAYYTSFIVKDTLANCLQLVNGAASISVKDQNGADVTSKFTKSISGQNIQISLNNTNDSTFYGKAYTITISCRKKTGYDMSSWFNTSGTGQVNNTASVTTDRGTKQSNSVSAAFLYHITTVATNGSISASQTTLKPNTSHTVTYSPKSADYVIDKVIVDGTAVSTSSYPSSYTFSSLKDDHSINVTFKRVYHIDTSAQGQGTITSTIRNIDKGQTKVITYTPANGCYIRSLTIDGKNIDLKKYPTEYTFSNISADHDVKAIFLPNPKIQITKEIYLDELHFPSGDPIFIMKAKGTDYLGDYHEYLKTIKFSESDISKAITENGRKKLKKTIIFNMKAGTYQFSEINTARYKLSEINKVVSGSITGDTVTLNSDGQDAKATFVNVRQQYHNFSDNDIAINKFSK